MIGLGLGLNSNWTLADGMPPERVGEVARVSSASWWTRISGLTARKYCDARYSGQTAGNIAAWDDLVGGADFAQVIEAQNPSLHTSGFVGDNGQYVEFRPASPSLPELLNVSEVAVGLTIPFTLFLVARPNIISASQKTIFELTNGGLMRWYLKGNTSEAIVQNNQGGPVKTITNTGARLATNRVNLHAIVVDGENSYLWDNGIKYTSDMSILGTWEPLTAQIGAQGTTLNGFDGDARAGGLFEGAATQDQLEALFSGLCGQVPTNCVFVGDEMMSPELTTLATAALSDYTWCESDVTSGSTLVEMRDRFEASVTPKYQPAMRNVIVLWGGAQDIYYGADGAATAARLWECCDYARWKGWRVLTLSMLPRGSFDPMQEARRVIFNAEFDQHWRNHADAAVRAERIYGLSAYHPSCWDPDTRMLNTEGNTRLARAIAVTTRDLCQL